MHQEVSRFIKRHQLLKKDKTVLVGVSGGPDSVALLHYLLSVKEKWRLNIIVVTIDHQLRGEESIEDVGYVESLCKEWDIPCERASLDVEAYKKKYGASTQIAAREVRYNYFEEQMNIHQADYLALGHHGDDQAETMVMRFVRSATPNAVTGIPVQRQFATGSIIRPLLCVTKKEIEDYCEKHQLNPRIDLSNEDTSYTRNFYRKHIIPLLKEENSNLHATMQYLSESFAIDEAYLNKEAEKMKQEIIHYDAEKKVASFDIKLFKSYPLSLQRRCYHLVLDCLYTNLPENISYVHEGIFFDLLEGSESNKQVDFPSNLKIEKSYHQMVFSFKQFTDDINVFKAPITVPGHIKLPGGGMLVSSYANTDQNQGKNYFVYHTSDVSLPLYVRTREPGDRMQWQGLSGSKKIKDVFIDLKIPRSARETWPIVVDSNDKILWLVGLRKAEMVTNEKDAPYIQLEYRE